MKSGAPVLPEIHGIADEECTNHIRIVSNNPVNLVDPSGLEEEHTVNPQEINRETHQTAKGRKKLEKAKKRATQKAATDAKLEGQEQFEQSKKLRQVHQEQLEDSLKEIKAEQEALKKKQASYKRIKNTKTIEIQEKLNELDEEIKNLKKYDDTLKHIPDEKLADKMSEFDKSLKVPRYGKRIGSALGRVVKVGGIILAIISFKQTAAEAGVGRAVVDTVPVLSDVVSLSEDYIEMHQVLHETKKVYREMEKMDAEICSSRREWTRKTALSWYEDAGSDIQITDPNLIDLTEVGQAVRAAENELSSFILVSSGLTKKQKDERIDAIKARLKTRLRDAVKQPAPVPRNPAPSAADLLRGDVT